MNNNNTPPDNQYTTLRITKKLHNQLKEAAKKRSTIFYRFTEELIKKALNNNDGN